MHNEPSIAQPHIRGVCLLTLVWFVCSIVPSINMDPYTPRACPLRKNNLTLSAKEYTKVCIWHRLFRWLSPNLMDVDHGYNHHWNVILLTTQYI